jgi:membrane associated rhomboid family serine protease
MIPLRDDNPTRIVPYVTWALIALNVIVYLFQATGGLYETRTGLGGTMAGWVLVPAELTQGKDYDINGPTLHPFWLTIFTSMFMHGGLLHLGGNMLYLAIFGNNVEDALGHIKYLFFYLVCGVVAAATQVLAMPNSVVPTLGASGAIAGVLGGYILLYPAARVRTLIFLGIFFTTIQVPAWVLLGFWIVSQFFLQWTQALRAVSEQAGGGVAYFAHIGGFLAGMALIRLLGAKPTPPTARPPYSGYGGYAGYRGQRPPDSY